MKLFSTFAGLAAVNASSCAPDDWADSDATDCAYYLENGYCTPDGEHGPNWNLSAWGPFSQSASEGYDATGCVECGCIESESSNIAEAEAPWATTKLAKLKQWGSDCLPDLIRTGAGQGGTRNLEKKLHRLHRMTAKFYNKNKAAVDAEVDVGDEWDSDRINRDDPCSCISGVAGGYYRFFDTAFDADTDSPRQSDAKTIMKNMRTRLNSTYGCNVPNTAK